MIRKKMIRAISITLGVIFLLQQGVWANTNIPYYLRPLSVEESTRRVVTAHNETTLEALRQQIYEALFALHRGPTYYAFEHQTYNMGARKNLKTPQDIATYTKDYLDGLRRDQGKFTAPVERQRVQEAISKLTMVLTAAQSLSSGAATSVPICSPVEIGNTLKGQLVTLELMDGTKTTGEVLPNSNQFFVHLDRVGSYAVGNIKGVQLASLESGGIDSRGFDGLPNDDYTAGIRTALVEGSFAACQMANNAFTQADLQLDADITGASGKTKTAGTVISASEQKVNVSLSEAQLKALNDLINAMGIGGILKDTAIIFIPGQKAHYSVGRNQLYLDPALLDNPVALRSRLIHEVIERTEVLAGLTAAEKQELSATRTNPAARSATLQAKIAERGVAAHNQLVNFAPFMDILTDTQFSAVIADYLNNDYNTKNGYPTGPLVDHKMEKWPTGLTKMREAIAMNSAGVLGLECAIGYLSKTRNKTPLQVLDEIVAGKVVKQDESGAWKPRDYGAANVLARFANTTWRAGQPFRGLGRTQRFVNRPFDLLPEDERVKDFVQIIVAAQFLRNALPKELANASPEEQLDAIAKLMQDPEFIKNIATELNNAYNRSAGYSEGPLIKPQDENTPVGLSKLGEAIGKNLAGECALIDAIGLILNESDTYRYETPQRVLQDIVSGEMFKKDAEGKYVHEKEAYLLARFANATWKAGQPFIAPFVRIKDLQGVLKDVPWADAKQIWSAIVKEGYVANQVDENGQVVLDATTNEPVGMGTVQEKLFALKGANELAGIDPSMQEKVYNALRGAYRITRGVFRPFDRLPPAEWSKDFDQIQTAAAFISNKITNIAVAPRVLAWNGAGNVLAEYRIIQQTLENGQCLITMFAPADTRGPAFTMIGTANASDVFNLVADLWNHASGTFEGPYGSAAAGAFKDVFRKFATEHLASTAELPVPISKSRIPTLAQINMPLEQI